MRYQSVLAVVGLLLLASCGEVTSQRTPPPSVSAPSATAMETAVQAELAASPTSPEPQPTVIVPVLQPLAPDSFSKAKPMHEFWPDVQKAAGLYNTIRFGTSVTGWALSPDGRYVAVAGCDAEVGDISVPYNTSRCEQTSSGTTAHAYAYIFDAKSGELVATLPESGQILTVTDLGFTHDGRKLVYQIYQPSTLKVWDIESAKVETTITDEALSGYDISPDDKWMLISFGEKQSRLWDLSQQKYVADIPIFYGEFSRDGRQVLEDYEPYLTIYDTGTWQKLSQQAMVPDITLMSYDVSKDFSLMAVCDTGLDDQPVRIWDVATATLLKSLDEKFGKCGQVLFSPDRKYLLFFNNHGAGPLVWSVDDWTYARGSEGSTNFVGATDLFVHRIEFSHDQSMMLVATFARLTLYSLPAGESPAAASNPVPTTPSVAVGTVEPPPVSCDLAVTGFLKLTTNLCEPGSSSRAGDKDQDRMIIRLYGSDLTSVFISVPDFLHKDWPPGKYVIGDGSNPDDQRVTAALNYYDASANSVDLYASYAETGEIVISEIGSVISGSFKFGARSADGKEINAVGSFTNVPYVHTNRP